MDMKTNIPETVSAGETLTDVQICPPGEWPNGKTVQHCDLDAFARIVRDWEAGGSKPVLCDFEHRSEDPSPTSDTQAAAWVSALGIGPDGSLVGNFTFTDEGAKAVSGRALRFLSPSSSPTRPARSCASGPSRSRTARTFRSLLSSTRSPSRSNRMLRQPKRKVPKWTS